MNPRTLVTIRGAKIGLPIGFRPKAALEAHTRGELDDDELIAALLAGCLENSDMTWESLSELDQYHRRGLLETGLFLTAKTELNVQFFSTVPPFRVDSTDRSPDPSALEQFSRGLLD